jgi:hypothetical protein
MKTAICELEGIAPLSLSAQYNTPKKEGEGHDDYDKRTWRDRAHTHADGRCYLPGISLAKALIATAQQLGVKIPGRRGKGWASVFKSGLMCPEPINLMQPAPTKIVPSGQTPNGPRKVPVMKDELEFVDVYCDAQGRPGSGKVWRRFPIIHAWSGMATILVVNDEITENVLRHHLNMCGTINGLGRYRAQNGGEFGRFRIIGFEWSDEAKDRVAA